MFTNISRLSPAACAEKNCSQELQNHQSLASPTDAAHTGPSAQSWTWLHSNSTKQASQVSSDYILSLVAPSVTLLRLHQDFTQPTEAKAAVSKPCKAPLPTSRPGSFLDWANDWINRWLGVTEKPAAQRITNKPTNQMISPSGTVRAQAVRAQAVGPKINQRGLGLLRQFEPLPSYSEQTLREIEQAVLRQVKVPLTSNQFSALVSLTYSLGEANLRRSNLLKYLNAGCYQAAADEFDRWVYVGPNRLPDLVVRRAAERKLFLQDH